MSRLRLERPLPEAPPPRISAPCYETVSCSTCRWSRTGRAVHPDHSPPRLLPCLCPHERESPIFPIRPRRFRHPIQEQLAGLSLVEVWAAIVVGAGEAAKRFLLAIPLQVVEHEQVQQPVIV